MTAETSKITALTPAQAAKILAAAGTRRITYDNQTNLQKNYCTAICVASMF